MAVRGTSASKTTSANGIIACQATNHLIRYVDVKRAVDDGEKTVTVIPWVTTGSPGAEVNRSAERASASNGAVDNGKAGTRRKMAISTTGTLADRSISVMGRRTDYHTRGSGQIPERCPDGAARNRRIVLEFG